MNLPPLPINEELQKLCETYPFLDLSGQIIPVHTCTKFFIVLVKHLDKIISELITTLGTFAKTFGFWSSLFGISGRILNPVANQVLSHGPFKKP
jgi:hypothetical protein